MVSLEFSQEPCLVATSGSDDWTDDDHVALHPLSAVEYYAILLSSLP